MESKVGRLLNQINEPNDIKKIDPREYRLLAKEIRQFLVHKISMTGGHLASNLGAVELTMALHLCLDFPNDSLVWDVGHQSYTHKLLTGRKEGFDTLRQFGGMSGFPKRSESNCDAFDTGHSSTSISLAIGMAKARELKKEKNNVLIIGEAGVGKSALVEKLAMLINQGKVVDSLKNKIIYELSLSSLVAGTKYRGEFEEKFKKIIDKVKDLDNVIIFIDEIHNVIGAGGAEGAIDASNILKPYLARKDMTVIGATTIDEYYKHFEKDHAMNRRFSIVTLKENTKEETLEILKGIKGYYESYHQIKIDNVLLKELIELVDCHIKNRTYPDKAIDILDLSCVKAKFYHEKELTKNRIVETIEKYLNITIHHQMDYQKLEKQLNKDILGQEKGIHQMIETFQHKQLPISFFIYGPTSCGKTLTAKSLAKYLNYHYLKLDMNQYQESHSLYKLLETYHEQPSLLLSTLQSYPHTVLLLDHIDQACEEIIHLFSQILDDGYYEDQAKRKISFENVVFIMSQTGTSRCCMGFKKSRQTKYLRHELFDKVDQIIEYQPLSKEIIEKIIHLREHISIEKIHNLLKEEHVPINLSKMMKQIKQMS